MDKKQFDKMIEGLVNPSRIKVCVNRGYDFLMSAKNGNDMMSWFQANGNTLENNLRKIGLNWVYIIETCPNSTPFIYMLISPKMSKSIADKLTDRAKRTLQEDREMYVFEGSMRYIEIDRYDYTKATLEELLLASCSDVLEVSEI